MNERPDRRAAAYFAVGILSIAAIVSVVLAVSRAGDDDGTDSAGGAGSAYIQAQSGATGDLAPDERAGTPPASSDAPALVVAAQAAGCELKRDLPEEGDEHLEPDDPAPAYGTNPATSGDHSLDPQADGAYLDPADEVNVVHSLEHGRVAFQYSGDVASDEQLAIKGVFDDDPAGMVLSPNTEMPYAVAATAWGQLMGCDSFKGEPTLAALVAFREEFRGQGPERVPISL